MLPFIRAAALGGLFLAAHAPGVSAAKPETPGYRSENASVVASLPIHVVVSTERLRPQIAFGGVETPYIHVNYTNYPNMSFGEGLAAGLAVNLLMSAAANAEASRNAQAFARAPYTMMQTAQCDLPFGQALGESIATRLRMTFPNAQVQVHVLNKDQKLDDVVDERAPRYVFGVSPSLAPDFSALITTIDSEAYLAPAGKTQAEKKPAWRDSIIIVSDRFAVPEKTPTDIETMVAAEKARYEALNMGPTIKRLNQEGPINANKLERKRVAAAISDHKQAMQEAQLPSWSPNTLVMRRAAMLSEQQCRQTQDMIAFSNAESARTIDLMLTDALPPRLAAKSTDVAKENDGERAIIAIPGGLFISRRGGDYVDLGYRYTLLPD
jgi:hypothetical protein